MTINLHIGAFKTGTSFLQSVLEGGRDTLSSNGILWPGRHWSEQVGAARGLLSKDPRKWSRWDVMAEAMATWDRGDVIYSMEFLSIGSAKAVERVGKSLAGQPVRVVLTARDVGRVLPAQWQESVQNGKSWSYRDYVGEVSSTNSESEAHRHFWAKQDLGEIVRRWQALPDSAELVVVTVPPSGGPRDLLWKRFCDAIVLDPDLLPTDIRVNESLGAASSEVMRYVSAQLAEGDPHAKTSRVVKKVLSKGLLSQRKSSEPVLVLPHELEPWATERSAELIADLRTTGVRVIGDLDDLTPQFGARRSNETEDPSALPSEAYLEAAGFGIAQLADHMAQSGLTEPVDSSAAGVIYRRGAKKKKQGGQQRRSERST